MENEPNKEAADGQGNGTEHTRTHTSQKGSVRWSRKYRCSHSILTRPQPSRFSTILISPSPSLSRSFYL